MDNAEPGGEDGGSRLQPLPPRPAQTRIEVVYCPRPGSCDHRRLQLPAGSSVAQALQASGVIDRHALNVTGLSLGIWGRRCQPETLLRDLDRVEIYRPLEVDPKEARRQRYRRQKTREPAPPGAPGATG